MKRRFLFLTFILISCYSLFAQSIDLEKAIKNISSDVNNLLKKDDILAVLEFTSPSENLSNHIQDLLTSSILENNKLRIVTRNHMDIVDEELNYHVSGFVSDKTALSICERLGAHYVLFGQISEFNDSFMFKVKMLEVETGAYKYAKNIQVKRSTQIDQLLGNTSNYKKVAIGFYPEINMYSATSFAIGGGLSFDYNFTRRIAAGLKTSVFYDINTKDIKIFTIEPDLFLRFYLVNHRGIPGTGMYLDGEAGICVINRNEELISSVSAGGALGYRFSIGNVYLDPSVRAGYPYIIGTNIGCGIRF